MAPHKNAAKPPKKNKNVTDNAPLAAVVRAMMAASNMTPPPIEAV